MPEHVCAACASSSDATPRDVRIQQPMSVFRLFPDRECTYDVLRWRGLQFRSLGGRTYGNLLFIFLFARCVPPVVSRVIVDRATPLLSRGGVDATSIKCREATLERSGRGGAGQTKYAVVDQHHPICAGLGSFAAFS